MFSFFFFFPEHKGRPTVGQSYSFASGLIGSFALRILVTFKSQFLNGEHVIISDRLTDTPHLMAAFAFGKGKMFDGEILALSAYSTLAPPRGAGAKYSWGYLKKYCPLLLSSRQTQVFVIPYQFRREGPLSYFLGAD